MSRTLVMIAAVALVGLAVAPTAAAEHDTKDGLTFVLSDEPFSLVETPSVSFQYKEGHGGNGQAVALNGCHTWAANATAEVDVEFPAQTVEASINGSGDNPSVAVGIWDDDTDDFTAVGAIEDFNGEFSVPKFTVPQGDYLATLVCADDPSATELATVWTADGSSSVTYQAEDNPNYPTPELSTMVLSSIGLLGAIGLTRFRRRQNR